MSTAVVGPRTRVSVLQEDSYIAADPDAPSSPGAVERSFRNVLTKVREAQQHFSFPVSRRLLTVEDRFHELAREWKRESALLSSTTEMATLPAYQRIIGLGPAVLPAIFAELRREPDHWFWALKAIAGVDPVPVASRGRLEEMRAEWLRWAAEQGLDRESQEHVVGLF